MDWAHLVIQAHLAISRPLTLTTPPGAFFPCIYSKVQHVDILGSQSSADHSSHHRRTKARVIPLTDKALRGGPPPLFNFTSWLPPSPLTLRHLGLLKNQVFSLSLYTACFLYLNYYCLQPLFSCLTSPCHSDLGFDVTSETCKLQ